MFNSIKTRIFLWLATSFAVLITVLGMTLNNRLETIVIEMVDHLLADKAELIKGLIHAEEGEVEFELSETAAGDYSIEKSGHYFEITDEKGSSLVRSKSLADATLTMLKTPGFHTIAEPSGKPMRLYIEEFNIPGSGKLLVYIAERISDELNLLKSFRLILVALFPLTIFISGVGSILILLVSFKPLSSFSSQIGLITEKRLHERVDTRGVDRELTDLAGSFNTMMDRLEKAFQAQKDFLSDASHEMRTPIAVIRSTTEVALRRDREAGEYKEALSVVRDATGRMGRLVDRLLRLSRLEMEQSSARKNSLQLDSVIMESAKIIMPLADERGIKTEIDMGPDAVIVGDREPLIEMFLSILDNAVKYNRPQGIIRISLTVSDGWAVTSISDTGIGISQESIGKIFDRFYRVDSSRGEIAGTGLGLPIALKIAEAHGGRIEVESEVGKGTTFFLYLPLTL